MKVLVVFLFCLSLPLIANTNARVIMEAEFSYKENNNIQRKFSLRLSEVQSNKYKLMVRDRSSLLECSFDVRRLTAPMQSIGLAGAISVYPNSCDIFKRDNIVSILSISYTVLEDSTATGKITIPKLVQKHSLDKINFY